MNNSQVNTATGKITNVRVGECWNQFNGAILFDFAIERHALGLGNQIAV